MENTRCNDRSACRIFRKTNCKFYAWATYNCCPSVTGVGGESLRESKGWPFSSMRLQGYVDSNSVEAISLSPRVYTRNLILSSTKLGFLMSFPLIVTCWCYRFDFLQIKILYYLMWVASEDVETQSKGIIVVIWPVSDVAIKHLRNKERLIESQKKQFQGACVRVCAYHFCVPNNPFFHVLKMVFVMSLDNCSRSRVKFHIGTFWFAIDKYWLLLSRRFKRIHQCFRALSCFALIPPITTL